ncbi:MAG: hypothetical protein A3D87_01380 [Omnitrophica WOR_2 bacterium RIFCSPHIGHO2_02_FULL_50_17]|nr:MAG: hypothetical protein A3D87_01380 [Omnitrophica WOR_2 bacterium RIFCSPHIGHO2_02_FULL_50_17]
MKIAIVAGIFPKISETFILNQIVSLIELGHEVNIFALWKPAADEKIHNTVFDYDLLKKTYYFDIPEKRFKRLFAALEIIFKNIHRYPKQISQCFDFQKYTLYEALNNLFKIVPFLDGHFDVIHCHFGPNANEFIFLKEIIKNTKMFVTFHGYDIRLGLKDKGSMYKELFEKIDGVYVTCQYCNDMLESFGCPKEKLIILPNGIDMDKFSPSQKHNGSKVVITTVGRLVKEKNIVFGLHILKALVEEKHRHFEYYVVGDGYMREEIKHAIHELHLQDTVHLLGALTENETIDVLKKTDILLLPSENEAFGVILLEAQAMEIPVIATDVGGVKEAMIDNKTGYLISFDAQVAKDKIMKLVNDQSVLDKMGKEGRKFVEENFNIKPIIKRMVSTYNLA